MIRVSGGEALVGLPPLIHFPGFAEPTEEEVIIIILIVLIIILLMLLYFDGDDFDNSFVMIKMVLMDIITTKSLYISILLFENVNISVKGF